MQESLALTWKTLEARLRNFRFGSASALAALLALAALAIGLRSPWVTLGLPVPILLGAVFLERDRRLLFAWEDRVLALWGASDLSMGVLARTLADFPHPLKQSLRAMAEGLPENGDYRIPDPAGLAAQRCLFWTRSLLEEMRLLRAAVWGLALACLPFSLWWFSVNVRYGWLFGLAPLAAVPLGHAIGFRRARQAWRLRRAGLPSSPLALPADRAERLESLDWTRVPARWRRILRADLGIGAANPGPANRIID
jgi:hypothetical protein